ncbi:histidine kinase [Clostridium novyi A str. 4552]|uniref:histidine kinase n=1 Tax=Clostridium novyi A str. 4552 TaxID=1444289 RepID=A0A0A0I1Z2_CLONO|nr:histidine kinase [Clostridium novyi A str. 4552]
MKIILIVIIVLLIIVIVNLNKKISNVSKILKELDEGNINTRIRMQTSSKQLKVLIEAINNLINNFQEVYRSNRQYEFERKKMITNISHDLRTPLTSLLGYIEFIKDNKNLTKAEINEYIKIIDNKGNDLRKLINAFFDFSKLETSDVRLKRENINLSELIRQNIILFYNDFNSKDVTPIIDIPKEDIYIMGDKEAMERILNNLISNAVKYGCDGKNIGVNLACYENKVEIVVWDEGKGIESENLDLIFKRLYTVEQSRNRNFKGSGLGLTIVKKLVEVQKGNIVVKSVPNKRTEFIVTIPSS